MVAWTFRWAWFFESEPKKLKRSQSKNRGDLLEKCGWLIFNKSVITIKVLADIAKCYHDLEKSSAKSKTVIIKKFDLDHKKLHHGNKKVTREKSLKSHFSWHHPLIYLKDQEFDFFLILQKITHNHHQTLTNPKNRPHIPHFQNSLLAHL